MKKNLQKIVSSILISTTVLSFASCGIKDESWSTETTASKVQSTVDPDVTTINFAVTYYCRIDDKKLKLFNEELKKRRT